MSEQERSGRVVKLVGDRWGLINSYRLGIAAPDKFFFHISWVKTPKAELCPGVRVTFTPGPPRSEKELPTALDVRVNESGVAGGQQ